MSIESTLAELTSAVRELTAVLKTSERTPAPQEAAEKPAGKPNKPKTASAPAAAPTAPTAEEPAAAQQEKAESSDKPLGYDTDVAPLFRQFVGKKGRDAAIAFIHSYKAGAGKLSDALKPAQYADAIAKLQAELS